MSPSTERGFSFYSTNSSRHHLIARFRVTDLAAGLCVQNTFYFTERFVIRDDITSRLTFFVHMAYFSCIEWNLFLLFLFVCFRANRPCLVCIDDTYQQELLYAVHFGTDSLEKWTVTWRSFKINKIWSTISHGVV